MRRNDVIAHFGTQQKVAEALGLRSTSTVSEWKDELIPLKRAIQVEELTGGVLKVDYSAYGISRQSAQ